jgi:outer membrane protein OmpA-like peptidoglycan-associated protein
MQAPQRVGKNDVDSPQAPFPNTYKIALAVSLLLLASLGIVSYYLYNRAQRAEEQLAELNRQITDLTESVERATESAAIARSASSQAEELAQIAARGRAIAEASQHTAELRAKQAEEEADDALELAHETQQELTRLRREREEELNRLQKALGRIVETRRTALGLVMNLGSDTLKFDFDKATLRPENREILSRIAGVLLTSAGYRVQIYGHTDDIGTAEYNQELSERRATTVREYLIEAGIDPGIIATKGFGKSNPLAPGTSNEARSMNRRVEIGIIDTMVNYEGVSQRESNQ